MIWHIFTVKFLTGSQMHGRFSGVRAQNFTKLGEDVSVLIESVSDFRCLAAFSKTGGSKMSGVENDANYRTFLTAVKTSGCLINKLKDKQTTDVTYLKLFKQSSPWTAFITTMHCQRWHLSPYCIVRKGLHRHISLLLLTYTNTAPISSYFASTVVAIDSSHLLQLREVVAICRQISLMDTCWQYGSWSAAGHIRMSMIW